MINKHLPIVAIVMLVALTLAISGCTTGTGSSDATAKPTAGAVVSQPAIATSTPPAAPTLTPVQDGTYKITTEGNNVIITGNGVVKTDTFQLPANWYTVKVILASGYYMDFHLMNSKDEEEDGYFGPVDRSDAFLRNLHYRGTNSEDITDTFYLKTGNMLKGTWRLEFIAPPASAMTATTVSGQGADVIAPISLPSGTGTIVARCSGPATNTFTVFSFQNDPNFDKYPGFPINMPDYTLSNVADGKVTMPFEKSMTVDTGYPNSLLYLRIQTDHDTSWTITVTPT